MNDKKNSLWLTIQFSFTLIVALINLKINILNYGSKIFGIWIMLASVWGVGTALDFGFGISVVKYVAEFAKHDKKRLNSFLSSSFVVFSIVGLIIFVIGNVAINFIYFTKNTVIPIDFLRTAKYVFIILGISFYFQYLTIFFKSIFEGLSNFVLSSKISLVQNLLLLISVIIAYLFTLKIAFLAVFYASSFLIIFLLYIVLLKRVYPELRISLKLFSSLEIKNIISFSLSVQTISVFSALIDPVIKYIVGNYYEIRYVSIYEIARRFSIAVSQMFFTIFRTILPKASVLKRIKDIKEFFLNETVKISKVGVFYSGIIFGTGSIIFAFVIKYLFGYEEAILVFLILSLPESINNFGYPIFMTLLGIGNAYFLSFIQLINLTIVTVSMLTIFALFKNNLGFLGYFVSVLIGNIFMLLYIKKKYGVNLSNFSKYSKLYKLVVHCLLLLTGVFLIFFGTYNYVSILLIVCILSFGLFYQDLKIYSKTVSDFLSQLFFSQRQ